MTPTVRAMMSALAATVIGCAGDGGPTTQPAGLTFASVSSGAEHACGLTMSGAAYCWGYNGWGQLGNGTIEDGQRPVAVAGGLYFTALTAGYMHNCGVTASGAAYCWGYNGYYVGFGPLGNGSVTPSSVPVAVAGGLTFSSVSPGREHTCGLTITGSAYCWGAGPLGNGSNAGSAVPVAVTGGLTFSALSAASSRTCGLTTTGAAYCWGAGPLGDGSTAGSSVPVAVAGGATFTAISAGGFDAGYACAVATSGAAYCWGEGGYGELGIGASDLSLVPVSVSGGLRFSAVDAGWRYHTCGLTTSGAAYCWGFNVWGQLGNGSTENTAVPAAVSGGLTFAGLSAGGTNSCGVTSPGFVYCWGDHLGKASAVPARVDGQQ